MEEKTYKLTYNDRNNGQSVHFFSSNLDLDNLPGVEEIIDTLNLEELKKGETLEVELLCPQTGIIE